MLVSLTVGKVDAGMAVLLTEDKRIIEFPSILLPPDISSGSIVDITVSRNHTTEAVAQKTFSALQSTIFNAFGQHTPSPPILRCRNATQTSVVLEWDPIQLATAELRSLSLFRNGSKAGSIPRPHELTSTKISGLAVETEYTFQLVLRTSAGTYSSEKLVVKTHNMADLTGITVTPGIMPSALRESLAGTLERIGAKLSDTVRIDTTHFVCTEPRGQAWERAVEMNIPVVVPDWVKGCENEGRIVGVRGYYLDADPRLRQMGPSVVQTQLSERPRTPPGTPSTKVTPPTPEQTRNLGPPAVPPKDGPGTGSGSRSSEEDRPRSRQSESTTLAEMAPVGKARKSSDGSDDETDGKASIEEEENSDSEKPSSHPSAHDAKASQPSRQAKVEDAEDGETSFQDVAL